MSRSLRPLWIGAIASSFATLAGANVLIVAPSGGDHANIQDAIEAAADGDVILVKSGAYPGFIVVDRDLAIVEDYGQGVVILGAVRVRNLSVHRDVLIDGLDVFALQSGGVQNERHGLFAIDCVGSVRVQDCSIRSGDDIHAGGYFVDCSDVVIVDSMLEGHTGLVSWASRGVAALRSNVAAYRSVLRGGTWPPSGGLGADGGDGVRLEASYLFAADSSVRGSEGHYGDSECGWESYCYDGGNGGDGIVCRSGSAFEYVATTVAGGQGGPGGCHCTGCCGDGSDGVPFVLMDGSTLEALPHPRRTMSLESPVREKTRAAIEFRGMPGDVIHLAMSDATHFAFDPSTIGVQVFEPGPLTDSQVLGAIDGSGRLTLTLELPGLEPGAVSRTQYVQAIFRDVNGLQHFGPPRALVVLDSAY